MKRTLQAVLLPLMIALTIASAEAQPRPATRPNAVRTPRAATAKPVTSFPPLNFREAAIRESANPPAEEREIDEIDAPQPPPPNGRKGVAIVPNAVGKARTLSTPLSPTGPSPAPTKTFKAEFLSSTSIPPDTMGAVGNAFVVSVTNDRMRIQDRNGVELSRMTLTAFWSGVTIKGVAASAFDPKVYYDRFNNRFMMVSSANAQTVNSGALFAVTQTNDPTGTWNRYSVATDPTSTAAGGRWIDYPTVGHNKNWIVVNENIFNYGTAGTGFWGTQIYAIDKQAAYTNTLGTISMFEADFATSCLASATPETELGCGFTMAPTITEDNTTDTVYLVEDWDSQAAQLRLSKITGTAAAPVLTVGTQFPQSANSWRFDAARIGTANSCGGTCSGGYLPQRQQSANLTSGTRIMANDSRVQNAVFRAGSLWCAHTVMLSATTQAAGTAIGGAGNPVDTHSGIQWWQIDPTNESGGAVAPLQRGRIEDQTADNCHNGSGGTNAVGPRCTSTATQSGEFYAFPNISVNQSNDVFIGFTRFSSLTYPNSAYVMRRSADPANTTRDPVVFRPGQANYNIGGGSGTARQNRWGDYSSAQTDPLNDTDFWTVQEYAGTVRDFGIGLAGNWETWWSQISPTGATPTTGTLIISEFRLRGPQGVRDEFVELYNPGATPVIVSTTDGSDGWALAYSNNGTTLTSAVAVVPNGTVIAPHGHFLIADNPDGATGPTLVYGLNGYPAGVARTADSDTGWSFDLADNGGVALFKTANTANFNAGNRLDSVGFAGIAAGLFKEGAGIPSVTATTPVGQMTFYRDLSTGSPADTGANENDFFFVDPVIETLGVTPKLGAAGPENLDGAVHVSASGLTATPLDPGAGLGSPANLFRDPIPGSLSTSTFGTITFRRIFTNTSGTPLDRLRFRIVNITTNPVVGAAADLRALTSSTGSVTLAGGGSVSVSGTTLETPPAQAVGGAFNSSFAVSGITPAAQLTSTVNVQFTFGVQVKGAYNVCVQAEGNPAIGSPVLCFTGTTENATPTITPGGPIGVTAGGAVVAGATIATVSDTEDAAGTLVVTATSVPPGIIVTNIVNTGGTVTADVSAGAGVTGGSYNVTLRVTDSEGATSTATLVVNVTPAAPTITPGGPTTFCAGGSVTLTSSAAAGNQWYLNGNPIGGETNSTYVATASGNYTVTVTEGGFTSAPSAAVSVTVNPAPPTPTITPGGPTTFCAGGSVTLTSSSATGNQWFLNGNPIGGETNSTYVATASGNYTVVVTASGCSSAPSAATTVTVNPTPPTPTISGTPSFCTGGSTTLTSSSATGNQWFLNGNPIGGATNNTYVVTAAGSYTVTVTASGCTSSPSAPTTVTVNPNPDATITAPASVATGSTGNAASVANAGAGATYTWGITGGTITSGAGTSAITFTAGGPGTLTLNVTVMTGAGCSDSKSANVNVTAMTVTLVNPASGPYFGGTSVTISGSGFNAGATVTFGGAAATNVVVVNSTTITAKTPAHAAGAVNVTVTNTDTSSATLTNGYLYNPRRFDPNGDNVVDPADIFYLINYLYTGGPAPAGTAGMLSGDSNGDNLVDPSDIFYAVNFLFSGGPAPYSTPSRTESTSLNAPRLKGSVTLGDAVRQNGRWIVPVIVSMEPGSAVPQAMSLNVRVRGALMGVDAHHAGDLQPIFETTRSTPSSVAYLIALGDKAPLTLGSNGSVVIAELELTADGGLGLEIDPTLTMLTNAGGTQKATVANGSLQIRGTITGPAPSPRPYSPHQN